MTFPPSRADKNALVIAVFFSYMKEVKCYRLSSNSLWPSWLMLFPSSYLKSRALSWICNVLSDKHTYMCLSRIYSIILGDFSINIITMFTIHSFYWQAFRFFQTFTPQIMLRVISFTYIFVHTCEHAYKVILYKWAHWVKGYACTF